MSRFRKNPGLLKSSTDWVFCGFWALLGFWMFLNEQLGSLLVDLAHQLSFFLD